MTRNSPHPTSHAGNHSDHDSEADLLAGLWEVAPFPRLPSDAPAELKDYVHDVENPKRVYTVYRASRRHNFMILVEKFVIQLRVGCGTKNCPTPTCFTYRKRAAGKAPIRRYNPTSARTLAVYLASQDNPETGLCPYLASPREPSAALHSLSISSVHVHDPHHSSIQGGKRIDSLSTNSLRKERYASASDKAHHFINNIPSSPIQRMSQSPDQEISHNHLASTTLQKLKLEDNPGSKDHRSFAANVFGTVAFRMLEWLTPNGVDYMTKRASEAANGSHPSQVKPIEDYKQRDRSAETKETRQLSAPPSFVTFSDSDTVNGQTQDPSHRVVGERNPEADRVMDRQPPVVHSATTTTTTTTTGRSGSRRNSNTKVRTPSGANKKNLPLEAFPPPTPEDLKPSIVSPKMANLQSDKLSRNLISNQFKSSLNYHDKQPHTLIEVSDKVPKPNSNSTAEDPQTTATPQNNLKLPSSPQSQSSAIDESTSARSSSPTGLPQSITILPQSINCLNPAIIDLFAKIMDEDGTAEGPLFEVFSQKSESLPALKLSSGGGKTLARRRSRSRKSTKHKHEWKMFIEQSLFQTLSNPQALLASFSSNQASLDSHTLWYCMLKLTRAAPTVVFESLWLAASSLFTPPKSLRSARSPTAKMFQKEPKSLTNDEAAIVMSVCVHALVAALPLVNDARALREVSESRSNGIALAFGGPPYANQKPLHLQYDDTLSNNLAIRLARRAFLAITTRKHFSEMVGFDDSLDETAADVDVLKPLFLQFENSEPSATLDFPPEQRPIYEIRMPTLLLDWAKSILLSDWDGTPEFSRDGAFGGAIILLAAMHENRKSLMVGDLHFRIDYFGERLDSAAVPVTWLSFTSSRQRHHLLDYPFIFSPSTLVSFFRSINFSRMSSRYEQSSTLPARVEGLDATGAILEHHHRSLLSQMLQPASSKYLVLDISRTHVLRDAFNQLWRRQERELLRPLKVHLGEDSGEEGFDSGGVQQEFFRLAIVECLNPDYGAFTVDERTRMAWFVPCTVVDEWRFELMGLLVSLAVHNGLTLPVTFPRALYRKLLGKPVCELHHVADGWPDLASGLTTLLEWDEKEGLVEDIFARTYEFSVSVFDQPISREMTSTGTAWPTANKDFDDEWTAMEENPQDAPMVTNANRNAYVTDYIRYLTDVSIRPQYEAFERGFHKCLHPKSLQLLTPALLQSVVEGVQEIDISELRRHARYVGWDANHRTVREFWSVVRRYSDRKKRRLLEFVTASDRVPVGGMSSVQFVVQRNGSEDNERGRLPTAYTCYGTLLLPEYKDKEMLRQRLGMALENAQGFGFA